MTVTLVSHPLITHKLTLLRDKSTPSALFRRLVKEIGALLVYEATKDLELEDYEVTTPIQKANGKRIKGKKLVFVPILRAGAGMLEGFLEVCPSARVGHVGLVRDHETLEAKQYLFRMPSNVSEREMIIVDPMLATGNSAIAAINAIKRLNPKKIKLVTLISAPEGVLNVQSSHPDVHVITGAIDECLNEKGYIVPGLGDAGDRIFGTE